MASNMLTYVIKNNRPLRMSQLLKHLDYGRKLRSRDIRSSYKSEIKTLVSKPTIGLNRNSPFEYKGRKFIKTFYTYNINNIVKKTQYRATLCVLNDKPKPTFQSYVQLYCSCADFKFRMAYNLRNLGILIETKTTISLLGKAYTDAPKDDKYDDLLICKHLYHLFSNLKQYRTWKY